MEQEQQCIKTTIIHNNISMICVFCVQYIYDMCVLYCNFENIFEFLNFWNNSQRSFLDCLLNNNNNNNALKQRSFGGLSHHIYEIDSSAHSLLLLLLLLLLRSLLRTTLFFVAIHFLKICEFLNGWTAYAWKKNPFLCCLWAQKKN